MITKLALAAAAISALAAPAYACQPRHGVPLVEVLDEYRSQFDERLNWMGNSISARETGTSLILVTSPDGSWTLFRTDGTLACQLDYGWDGRDLRGSGV